MIRRLTVTALLALAVLVAGSPTAPAKAPLQVEIHDERTGTTTFVDGLRHTGRDHGCGQSVDGSFTGLGGTGGRRAGGQGRSILSFEARNRSSTGCGESCHAEHTSRRDRRDQLTHLEILNP